MNFKHLIKETPTTLTISPTHKCTASCFNCCIRCSPRIKYVMPLTHIKRHIDMALNAYPSIQLVVLTGGECFLLGTNLNRVIKYVNKKKRLIRVVTNVYWAKDYESAYTKLRELQDLGLTELNISTGDNHQQFIPPQNVFNAIDAGLSLGIVPIVVAVESHFNSKFTKEDIEKMDKYKIAIERKKLIVINASWMNFVKEENCHISYNNNLDSITMGRCEYLFHNIVINPYSQMMACCGLTVEYNPYLKLGNVNTSSIKDLYEKQFEDLFKLWLYVDGPKYIYDFIHKWKLCTPLKFPHKCAYCIEIVKDSENISILQANIKDEMANILSRLHFSNIL